jgi:hypothetical protein
MPTLAAVAASPMMREYAQGAAQSNVQPVADFLAPVVNVPTSLGRFKKYTEKNKFHLPDTLRAIGGRATVLDFDATDLTYNCLPHALDFPVDFIEERESSFLESVLKEGADTISQVATLSHEVNVINAAVAAMNANSPVTKTWTDTSDDPVGTIDAAILQVIKAARYGSLMGIGVLFGATAWMEFKNNAAVRSKFVAAMDGGTDTAGIAMPTVANVGNLFVSNPTVKQSFMVVDSAAEGVADNIGFVLDKAVMVFARLQNPTRRDPSFMKTFRLDGLWMVPGTYMRDDGRVQVAKYDWSEDVQVTNTQAGQIINLN